MFGVKSAGLRLKNNYTQLQCKRNIWFSKSLYCNFRPTIFLLQVKLMTYLSDLYKERTLRLIYIFLQGLVEFATVLSLWNIEEIGLDLI